MDMVPVKCINNVLMAIRLSHRFYLLYKNLYTSLQRFSVDILESLNTNKYTVKDLSNFATEIVDQDSSNFVGGLDIFIFINIPLEETIGICSNKLFKNCIRHLTV